MQKKQNAASKKMLVIHLENCAEKYSPYGPRFLCCTASKFVQGTDCNKCSPRFLCPAWPRNSCPSNRTVRLPWDACQLKVSLSWLPRNSCTSLSSLFSSLFSQEWMSFASLKPFCLNPKWVSNPTVKKDPIQWLRFNESKNHIYLNHLNKFTHPLKFIKKWL